MPIGPAAIATCTGPAYESSKNNQAAADQRERTPLRAFASPSGGFWTLTWLLDSSSRADTALAASTGSTTFEP